MPLFQRNSNNLSLVKPMKFSNEKELQGLIEQNLEEIFNCRFVATEFSTGPVHGGRIDSLALSEENSPIIIEYKVVESSQLINQSLYYLSWMSDHKGDFALAVQKAFPSENISIDWSDIRVICIAPEYKKYDLHAVQMMGANIELWEYRYYENGALFFEQIYKKSMINSGSPSNDSLGLNKNKNLTSKSEGSAKVPTEYTLERHYNKTDKKKLELFYDLQDYILGLDESVQEVSKKYYIAYKITQNFVCVEMFKHKIVLYLKIDPTNIDPLPSNCRDVTNIGHYGTGNFEMVLVNEDDLPQAKELISIAFNNIGGN